jgi:DNA-binding beta-propeller fold protein YncE
MIPTPEPQANIPAEPVEAVEQVIESEAKDEGKRRILLVLLLLLLLSCCCAGYFIIRYLAKPQPLPEMLPAIAQINTPPTYKFSFPLDNPVSVAVSPDGQRIYGAESEKERLIKLFDRDGQFVTSFAPPFTTGSNRSWAYMAVDASGRLFAVDTYNSVIAVFDQDGHLIDGLIAKDVTLSGYIAQKTGGILPPGTLFYYSGLTQTVDYQMPGGEKRSLPGPKRDDWTPLGVRFDPKGNLLVTNAPGGMHQVLVYPAEAINGSWLTFAPQVKAFGIEGKGNGQFSFPNTVMADSQGNFYVSDGNNGRISIWTPETQYKTFFGFGSSENALDLPRGLWMDSRDRLHVADAVGQSIRVYDVSGAEPASLYSFGEFGSGDGQFSFPNDICIDSSGRLYIADRQNKRIQVWSY